MRQFLLQMAGEPGSGKSTLARAIGAATGAVVLDKDVIKSAALNAGAEESLAGPLSYLVLFDLTTSLLTAGQSVVLDSPAFWPSIIEKGTAAASGAGVAYFVLECSCSDGSEVERRIAERAGMASQPTARLVDPYGIPGTARLTLPHLVIDTRRSHDQCLQKALEYLGYDPS